MATILITGTSGLIGNALANHLSTQHTVIAFTRNPKKNNGTINICGDFTKNKDLQNLNDYQIDLLVHLGAITGAGYETDCFRTNVLGTHELLRYLIDRKCKKFVLASSVAAAGTFCKSFQPLILPIPDDHPCLDEKGYGMSKYLMEEVTKYHSRQDKNLDFINIRLGSVPADTRMIPPFGLETADGSITRLTVLSLKDAVNCFTLASETKYQPGVRIMNAVGSKSNTKEPVANIIKKLYGTSVDFSYYEQKGKEYDPIFNITKIKNELGFIPKWEPEF